ncbi:hypothetical protein TYRP_022872 [Tyrophagus putrescentiae]|nr:hypothetical protein TYRP_022872 [Tyrophagus putrescentiae]
MYKHLKVMINRKKDHLEDVVHSDVASVIEKRFYQQQQQLLPWLLLLLAQTLLLLTLEAVGGANATVARLSSDCAAVAAGFAQRLTPASSPAPSSSVAVLIPPSG